jgi:hypothetical protein
MPPIFRSRRNGIPKARIPRTATVAIANNIVRLVE